MTQPDFDIKNLDLASYFAPFGRRQMPDKAIWLLSLASTTMPENSVGAEVWLARVSGTYVHDGMLRRWAHELADAFGKGQFRPLRGKLRRPMFSAYSPRWGHIAADDGILTVITGRRPPTRERCRELDVHHDKFDRMVDLVAALAAMQCDQYEDALRWAVCVCRNREIDLDALSPRTIPEAC